MTTPFALKPRRDDPAAAQVVQRNLEQLRDVYDAYTSRIRIGFITITNGNTSVVVGHSLATAVYAAFVTPTSDPGGRVWISNKTSTAFTINLSTPAPLAGVTFDWLVKGA